MWELVKALINNAPIWVIVLVTAILVQIVTYVLDSGLLMEIIEVIFITN